MAPVAMESILATPTWPTSLANFVTWCLMWDPRSRPTSVQALQHEYFKDAVDPLLLRASTPSRVGKRNGELASKQSRDSIMDNHPTLEKKNSWFRKSFIGNRTEGVVSPPPTNNPDKDTKPRAEKRSTWHAPKLLPNNGVTNNAAPMMILPSIKPVSPLSDAVSVEAARLGRGDTGTSSDKERRKMEEKAVKKIGRQLSVASTHSQNNGYSNGMQNAVDKLNGNVTGGGHVTSPTTQKESFFSHLRKRARRLSGRPAGLSSSDDEDLEGGVGCGIAWGGSKDAGSNRSSMLVDTPADPIGIDKTIKENDTALDESHALGRSNSQTNLRRNLSFPPTPNASRAGETSINCVAQSPVFPRTRRSVRDTKQRYETPDENDELADEVLAAASNDYRERRVSQKYESPARKDSNKDLRHGYGPTGYPTPSPQANQRQYIKGLDISGKMRRDDDLSHPKWPTPPSEGDGGWGQQVYAAVTASSRR
jgi:meiosis induction protein kinase IME2/SME1